MLIGPRQRAELPGCTASLSHKPWKVHNELQTMRLDLYPICIFMFRIYITDTTRHIHLSLFN